MSVGKADALIINLLLVVNEIPKTVMVKPKPSRRTRSFGFLKKRGPLLYDRQKFRSVTDIGQMQDLSDCNWFRHDSKNKQYRQLHQKPLILVLAPHSSPMIFVK